MPWNNPLGGTINNDTNTDCDVSWKTKTCIRSGKDIGISRDGTVSAVWQCQDGTSQFYIESESLHMSAVYG